MTVLADTSVWSLALRRPPERLNRFEQQIVQAWKRFIHDGELVLAGPIRQEILSGIRNPKTFDTLVQRLTAFDDLSLEREDFVRAAEFFNLCRSRGVVGSSVDMLICSLAFRHKTDVFTVDNDFTHYARILPIRLYKV